MKKTTIQKSRQFLLPALALCILGGCLIPQIRHAKPQDGQESGSYIVEAAEDPEAGEKEVRNVFSMDTVITLTAYGQNRQKALDMAEAEILRLNDLLSTGLADSEISRLNASGSMILSDDTSAIVAKALELYDSTDGLFDITIYPLMQLWGFTSQQYHVPTAEELDDAVARIGSDRIAYNSESHEITLGEGQTIDLGGIAKGFTSARLMDIYRQAGISSGLVSLGGNVQCLNAKPDGSPYRIAIRDPFGTELDFAATMEITNEAIITSGGYERYFTDEASGVTYQHIMNPRTGNPAKTDLASVSITTQDGMLGDGLSTSLYIMGMEGAVSYWREHQEEFQMVLIDPDGNLFVTEGLKDQMLTPERFSIITAGNSR